MAYRKRRCFSVILFFIAILGIFTNTIIGMEKNLDTSSLHAVKKQLKYDDTTHSYTDPEATKGFGETVLNDLVRSGNIEVLRFLLDNNKNKKPYQWSRRKHYGRADCDLANFNIYDGTLEGHTMLETATRRLAYVKDIPTAFNAPKAIYQLLVDYGADPDIEAQNNQYMTGDIKQYKTRFCTSNNFIHMLDCHRKLNFLKYATVTAIAAVSAFFIYYYNWWKKKVTSDEQDDEQEEATVAQPASSADKVQGTQLAIVE